MAGLRDGFRFAHGLAGLLGGGVILVVGVVLAAVTTLGVGGGSVADTVILLGGGIAILSPLWYWLLRPLYVWRFGERDAPWYRPPGTLHESQPIRYTAIFGYVLVAGVVIVILLAVIFGGGGGEIHTIGETATNEGVAVTVSEVRTADELTEQGGFEDETVTPTAGATFLLVHLEVENVGETRAEPPGGELIRESIEVRYKDTSTDPMEVDNFTVTGIPYPSYTDQVSIFDNEIFPGQSVDGWLVFELPQGFDREAVRIRIEVEGEVLTWRPPSDTTDSERLDN